MNRGRGVNQRSWKRERTEEEKHDGAKHADVGQGVVGLLLEVLGLWARGNRSSNEKNNRTRASGHFCEMAMKIQPNL